jgi:phosphomannomutase
MVYGVPKRNVEAAETDRDRPQGRRIPHIEHEDLRDTPKLLGLFKQFADLGIVADCEGDRVDFVACAESVLRIENGNPAGLFAERLRNWPKRRGWVSHADEENAARRLRALRGA